MKDDNLNKIYAAINVKDPYIWNAAPSGGFSLDRVISIVYEMGFENARQKAIKIVKPYHTSGGNDENGCPHMCASCRERRDLRDKIKEMNGDV